MSPPEPNYSKTARPEYSNAAETQENIFKNDYLKMIEVSKKEMKKNPLNEIEEKTNKKNGRNQYIS